MKTEIEAGRAEGARTGEAAPADSGSPNAAKDSETTRGKVDELSEKISNLDKRILKTARMASLKQLLAKYNLEERADMLMKLVPEEKLELAENGTLKNSEEIIGKIKTSLPELFNGAPEKKAPANISRPSAQAKRDATPQKLSFGEVRRLAAEKYRRGE